MIEIIDFKDPFESLKKELPHFEHYNYVAEDLTFWLFEMYLPGVTHSAHRTETLITITVADEVMTIPVDADAHSWAIIYAVVEKINIVFQQYEIEERVYCMRYNLNPAFYYLICTPAEAAEIFSQFEQNKEVRLADPEAYFSVAFVLPAEENTKEAIVYNVGGLPFNDEEYKFLQAVGFPIPLALIVANAIGNHLVNLRVLRKYNEDNEQLAAYANGIVFRGRVEGDEAVEKLNAYSDGYYLFSTEMYQEYESEDPNEWTDSFILKLDDQFEVLRFRHTNGMNYSVATEAIIEKLQKWDAKYGLTIKGVDYDWVDFMLHTVPEDLAEFAEEVYAFCPDSIDQGVGSMEMLKYTIEYKKYICLWWD